MNLQCQNYLHFLFFSLLFWAFDESIDYFYFTAKLWKKTPNYHTLKLLQLVFKEDKGKYRGYEKLELEMNPKLN